MGLIIGIDVGSTTTKIVGLDQGKVLSPMCIKADDPITSLFGAFGKYIYDNGIALADIEQVMLTGVGSSKVSTPIYGLPTNKVDEFLADGLGAKFAVDIDPLMVVSMGTGTTFVQVKGNDIQHRWRHTSGTVAAYAEDTQHIKFGGVGFERRFVES